MITYPCMLALLPKEPELLRQRSPIWIVFAKGGGNICVSNRVGGWGSVSLPSGERSVEDCTLQTKHDLLTITVSSHFGSETFPCVQIRTDKETLVF